MKKIVKGKLYDTDNSDLVYSDNSSVRKLYRTQDGFFFMMFRDGSIVPKTEDSAKAYLGEKDPDKYIEIWGNPKPIYDFPALMEETVRQLDEACNQTIRNGIDVALSTGTEHFSLDYQDQINLMALSTRVAAGQEMIEWHADDQFQHCKYYSNADMQLIIESALSFVSYNITYFRDLRIYVRTFTKESDLKNVYYGMAIPEEYKSEVLKNYESKKGGANK